MKERIFKKIISTLLVFTLIISLSGSVFAAEPILPEIVNNKTVSDVLSNEQKEYLGKLQSIFDKFYFDDDGFLKLDIKYEKLQKKYGFSDYDIEQLDGMLNASAQISINQFNSNQFAVAPIEISPNAYVENWIIYFTYDDMMTFLYSAAVAGPAAMFAAINAIAYLISGPGGMVVTILSIIGLAGLAGFCYLVLQAAVMQQGVYIGIEWNGPFPNIVQGTWDG